MTLTPHDSDQKRFPRPLHRSETTGRAKRTRKRLRRIPGLWARLAVLAVVVVALMVGMVGLTLKAVRPYRQASVEAVRLAATRNSIMALESDNDTLRRQIAYLKTPEGIAAEAHPLGYVHPGERILVMPGFPAGAADDSAMQETNVQNAPVSVRQPLFARFLGHLREL